MLDKQFLRRLHNVKYRELKGLIGKIIPISSFGAIATDVLAAIAPCTGACGKLDLRSTNMRAALAKYKLLDLSFASANLTLTSEDRVNRTVLASLGFVPAKGDLTSNDAFASDDGDPSCIRHLVDYTREGCEWIKVFLDVWPIRNAFEEYMAVLGKRRTSIDAEDHVLMQLMRQVDGLFPSQFRIRDACITSSDFVWLHKHFYM
jgi:hypothetical protein